MVDVCIKAIRPEQLCHESVTIAIKYFELKRIFLLDDVSQCM